MARAPYSTKLPGSTRSSRFSRAVRWLVLRRRADGVGPLVVERQRAALEILGEVGPDVVEIDLLLDRRALHLDVGLLDEQQRMAFEDRLAGLDRDPPHVAARRTAAITCSIFMASMISSGWPARDGVALLHGDADDRALHRRGHRHGALRRVARHASCAAGCAVVLPNASTASGSTASTRAPACRPAGRRRRGGLEIEPGLQLGRRGDQLLGMLVDEARMDLVRAHIAVSASSARRKPMLRGRAFEPERRPAPARRGRARRQGRPTGCARSPWRAASRSSGLVR